MVGSINQKKHRPQRHTHLQSFQPLKTLSSVNHTIAPTVPLRTGTCRTTVHTEHSLQNQIVKKTRGTFALVGWHSWGTSGPLILRWLHGLNSCMQGSHSSTRSLSVQWYIHICHPSLISFFSFFSFFIFLVIFAGGKLVGAYVAKRAKGPRCGDTGVKLNGIPALRPKQYAGVSKRVKTVSRAYGGSLCGAAVKARIVRAFLIEEQKIVKKVLQEKSKSKKKKKDSGKKKK